MVAQHYTAAGLHAEALSYWQRAGQRAIERLAHREAVGCFEQALSALLRLPETRDTCEQAIDLRLTLRTALLPSGDPERILVCLREAEAIAVALDDPRRLGQVSHWLSGQCYFMGAHDQAIAAAQRPLTLATSGGEVTLHTSANYWLGLVYRAQGHYQQAIDCLRQLGPESFGRGVFSEAVDARNWLAWCHAELGTFAQGRALGDEGLQIAEALAHPASFMIGSLGVGLLALRQGDLCRALSKLERALDICQEMDLPFFLLLVAGPLGAAYTLSGRVTDAILLLTKATEQATAMQRVDLQALCRLPLGEAYLLAGRMEEAHALAEDVLALTRRHQGSGHQAYALRLLGDIVARRELPDVAPAEAYYQQALALAEALGMRPLQAHCYHGLGTLYSQTNRATLARTALSTAIALYRAMDMTFWLPTAEAALAQVERERQ